MPRLEKQWYLSFDIKPNAPVSSADASILHTSRGSFNERIPSIHFKRGTLRLHICIILNVKTHNCFVQADPLSTNFFTNIKLMQSWDTKMENYVYKVYINGKLIRSAVNSVPLVYKNVKVYAANPWQRQANALIKNLVFVNIPHGKGKTTFSIPFYLILDVSLFNSILFTSTF